jgi:tetratricopeptide (TPR) repeat protein
MIFPSVRPSPIFTSRNIKTVSIFWLMIIVTLLTSCISPRESRKKIDILSVPDSTGRAQSLFSEIPRTLEHVAKAYELIAQMLEMPKVTDSDRYHHFILASRYAVWLSYYQDEKFEKIQYAKAAISHADQAVSIKNMDVAGYYYRAIATGLYAQQSPLSVPSAMHKIRYDATKAIELDRIYDDGGPCRVLGGLYLRAPGAPVGLGSIRKALKYLKQAQDIAPENLENKLLLAEGYLKINKKKPAAVLLKSILMGENQGMEGMEGIEGRVRRQRTLQLFQDLQADN